MNLTEYVDNVSSKISDNIMKGVLVLGPNSKNKRKYTKACMSHAVEMYENSPVYIDHVERGNRKLNERFGTLKNARLTEDGIRADLHYLKSHPSTAVICEDAENASGMFGLSHNVNAECHKTKEGLTVDRILNVCSVDVVSGSATTKNLFEQLQENEKIIEKISDETSEGENMKLDEETTSDAPESTEPSEMEMAIEQVVLAILRDDSLDVQGKLSKIEIALSNGEELAPEGDTPAPEEEKAMEQKILEVEELKNELLEIKKQLSENIYIRPRTTNANVVKEQTLDLKELGKKIRGEK